MTELGGGGAQAEWRIGPLPTYSVPSWEPGRFPSVTPGGSWPNKLAASSMPTAIAGMPREAWEVHADRSAQIDAAVGPGASYQARSVAARETRDPKVHEPVDDRVGRWRDELARAGYPPVELGVRSSSPASPTNRPA